MLETLLPFLQAHLRSLRSVALKSTRRIDLSSILSVVSLPNLTHFKLVQVHPGEGGLARFFEGHSTHLTHFEFIIGKFAMPSSSAAVSFFD